ncbi:MAG: hypothetical protein RLZZ15_1267, partial [Verrucomicrobiota bacterium]
ALPRSVARLGRADPQLLSPIRHRNEATQRVLVRLETREALVRSRVNLVNSARLLLKSLGVFMSSSIKAQAFTRKVRAQLAPPDALLVTPLLTAAGVSREGLEAHGSKGRSPPAGEGASASGRSGSRSVLPITGRETRATSAPCRTILPSCARLRRARSGGYRGRLCPNAASSADSI